MLMLINFITAIATNEYNLNTSHVNVNQKELNKILVFNSYLNTSHVNVNP